MVDELRGFWSVIVCVCAGRDADKVASFACEGWTNADECVLAGMQADASEGECALYSLLLGLGLR